MEPKPKYITKEIRELMTLFEGERGEIRRLKLDRDLGLAFTVGDAYGLLTVSRPVVKGDIDGNEIVSLQADLRVAAQECNRSIYRFKKIADEQVCYVGGRVFNVMRFSVFFGEQLRLFDDV